MTDRELIVYNLINQAINIIDCNVSLDDNEDHSWELTSKDIEKILSLLLESKERLSKLRKLISN